MFFIGGNREITTEEFQRKINEPIIINRSLKNSAALGRLLSAFRASTMLLFTAPEPIGARDHRSCLPQCSHSLPPDGRSVSPLALPERSKCALEDCADSWTQSCCSKVIYSVPVHYTLLRVARAWIGIGGSCLFTNNSTIKTTLANRGKP